MALEYGAKIQADKVFLATGGGATNVAVTFARMGLRTACVCKVGRDSVSQRIIDELQPEGIDTSRFTYSDELHTGFSVIVTTFTGDRTILVHRGASTALSREDVPWDIIARTPWLYLGSMAGPAAELWPVIARFCGEHGVKLAINPGRSQRVLGLEGLRDVYANTTIIFVNQQEARQLTGVPQERGPDDETRMLQMLHDAGCQYVVITDGAAGAYGYDGTAQYFVPAYEVDEVSTVGAGDAFAAGCVVGLFRNLKLPDAMRIGAANAAHVVQEHGAKRGIISWQRALQFIAEQK